LIILKDGQAIILRCPIILELFIFLDFPTHPENKPSAYKYPFFTHLKIKPKFKPYIKSIMLNHPLKFCNEYLKKIF
jgi:hypothetical protein